MKLVLICLLTCMYTCFAQNEYRIKKIKEYTFVDQKSFLLLNEPKLISEYYYDCYGRRIKKITFDSNYNIQFTTLYEYDNNSVKNYYAVRQDYFTVTSLNRVGDTVHVTKADTMKNGQVVYISEKDHWFFCSWMSPLVKCTCNKEGNIINAIRYFEYFPQRIQIQYLYEYEYW